VGPGQEPCEHPENGLDFTDAEEVFRGVLLVSPDTREDYGEKRWAGLGVIGTRTVKVVFAELGHETIRIISLRKATRHERKEYEETIQNGLEAG
jgi:uncharacterized DUF497 family protein